MITIRKTKNRPADTFQARSLHEARKAPDIDSFIEYRVRTEHSLGIAQEKRKGKREL